MKKKWTIDDYMGVIIAFVLVSIFVVLIYCGYVEGHPKWINEENIAIDNKIPQIGDMLLSRLSGERVQVLAYIGEDAGWGKMRYAKIKCRVISGRIYRDSSGLLSESKDSYVREYSVISFQPYELQWISEKQSEGI